MDYLETNQAIAFVYVQISVEYQTNVFEEHVKKNVRKCCMHTAELTL